MYGTLMRGRVRPQDRPALLAAMQAAESVPVAGFLGSHLMFPDGQDDTVYLAVFFTDEAAYRRNAEDPAQHERYLSIRVHLLEDPSWSDGAWHSFVPGEA